jgi:hypothetical protein
LEKACRFGCEELQDLKDSIKQYKSKKPWWYGSELVELQVQVNADQIVMITPKIYWFN